MPEGREAVSHSSVVLQERRLFLRIGAGVGTLVAEGPSAGPVPRGLLASPGAQARLLGLGCPDVLRHTADTGGGGGYPCGPEVAPNPPADSSLLSISTASSSSSLGRSKIRRIWRLYSSVSSKRAAEVGSALPGAKAAPLDLAEDWPRGTGRCWEDRRSPGA